MNQTNAAIICGVTGAGKTSLINLLLGQKPTKHKMEADTLNTFAFTYERIKLIDTPGFLDNREDVSREELFQNMLDYIHKNKFQVKKILICANNKMPPEALRWFTDMVVATRATEASLCMVLTKIDDEDDKESASDLIDNLQNSLPGVQVITTGKRNLEEIKKVLSEIHQLPTLSIANVFETAEVLSNKMKMFALGKKNKEKEHEKLKELAMNDKQQNILMLNQLIEEKKEEIDEAKRQNCPDRDLIEEGLNTIIEYQKKIYLYEQDKINLVQLQADTKDFEKHIERIRKEFLSRQKWFKLFRKLLPRGVRDIIFEDELI